VSQLASLQRLSLSEDDRKFLKQVEEEAEKATEMLPAEADEVEITNSGNGSQEVRLKFDLTKDTDSWRSGPPLESTANEKGPSSAHSLREWWKSRCWAMRRTVDRLRGPGS